MHSDEGFVWFCGLEGLESFADEHGGVGKGKRVQQEYSFENDLVNVQGNKFFIVSHFELEDAVESNQESDCYVKDDTPAVDTTFSHNILLKTVADTLSARCK